MKLLIFTQKVDKKDPVLGFFHTWIEEFSKQAESVSVICLFKGDYDLPKNVTVYSLGKESGASKLSYITNLYKYLFLIRGSYDKVFVHMNQEYVLLAGLYWRMKNIPVYLWRNHPNGNILTILASILSKKVFCTSKSAYVASLSNAVIMPVGNDSSTFAPVAGIVRKKHSVCMLGRIAPVKHIELALEAINYIVQSGAQISLSIIGSAVDKDLIYINSIKKYIQENNLSSYVFMEEEQPYDKHPEIFSSYEINLNLTETGSFDKTIVGGTSCGAIPLVSNESLGDLLPKVCITSSEPKEIADSLLRLLDPHIQVEIQKDLELFVKSQSLDALTEKLFTEMK